MAGFLACPSRLDGLPKRAIIVYSSLSVAMKNAGFFTELTATGTAPVFHRIPFY
jgi:hypothetical protein